MDKMLDGQLDECNLTFAEVALIEEAFLRVLVTRYHSRIRYPARKRSRPAAARNSGQQDHHRGVADQGAAESGVGGRVRAVSAVQPSGIR